MTDDSYQQAPESPRFAYAINMAARFLEENNVCQLPVDIRQIIDQLGWQLQKFSKLVNAADYPYTIDEFCEEMHTTSGYSVPCGDKYIIAYNDMTESEERIRFTLCHEIGHCYLKHFTSFDTKHLTRKEMAILDCEADTFAANLLIPATVYDSLRNPENIRRRHIFGVSKTAYTTRSRTIARDRMLLNEDSLAALNKLFYEYVHEWQCQSCGTRFMNESRQEECPHCGAQNVRWVHAEAYLNKVKEDESRRHYRFRPLNTDALAHRKERIEYSAPY